MNAMIYKDAALSVLRTLAVYEGETKGLGSHQPQYIIEQLERDLVNDCPHLDRTDITLGIEELRYDNCLIPAPSHRKKCSHPDHECPHVLNHSHPLVKYHLEMASFELKGEEQ